MMSVAVTVIPTNGPAPTLCTSVSPAYTWTAPTIPPSGAHHGIRAGLAPFGNGVVKAGRPCEIQALDQNAGEDEADDATDGESGCEEARKGVEAALAAFEGCAECDDGDAVDSGSDAIEALQPDDRGGCRKRDRPEGFAFHESPSLPESQFTGMIATGR